MSEEIYLKVGIIQTCIPNNIAWSNSFNMSPIAIEKAWYDIKNGFHSFINHQSELPDIVLLPEYSIPHCYLNDLKRLSTSAEKDMMIIGGLDFYKVSNDIAKNKAVIILPNHWHKEDKKSFNASIIPFGKHYFSNDELSHFKNFNYRGLPEPAAYIIDTKRFGKIGITICSDLYDLERYVIYRGRIQHLLVIAYNRDKETFHHIVNALSRILLCNVVVCNTGFFGDSIAITPYKDRFKRTIFKFDGANLSNSQVIELPVKSLIVAQVESNGIFKSIPPGFHKL